MGFCYQKNFSHPTLPVDEAQFWALVRATKWNEVIDQYRETHDAALKLPAFIFQAMFDETESAKGKLGAWRKQSATRLTGLVVMDIDHVDNPREKFAEWGLSTDYLGTDLRGFINKDTASSAEESSVSQNESRVDPCLKNILLVYVTPSGKGLKIVFKADVKKGNLIDNQHAMAKVLGVEVDESCKDASRMSFICKESDILFINKELFTYENKEFAERYNALYRDGRSGASPNPLQKEWAIVTASECPLPLEGDRGRLLFKGVPYSEIIDEWWKRNGGVPQEGERNVKLYQLAVSLRAICDNNHEQLMAVMPRLGLDEQELRSIVESACKEPPRLGLDEQELRSIVESACKEPPKGLSKALASILREMGIVDGEHSVMTKANDDMARWLWDWGAQIEALMGDFPLLRDVCKGLKRNQYPAALFVGGGLLMTLMTRCTYRFYHRPEELRRLNNSTLIIGDPASGKSFATRLFKLIASPIVAADKIGKDAINAYREQMRTKGANKEKPKKPKVIVRVHPARTSNAQFIQDMVNSVEEVDGELMQLHMLTFDTELDNTVTVQKGGSWIDKQSLELKAFHNEEDGQAYSNNDSVLQDFYVTWNFIYTGTPIALKKKVNEQNFGSGLATRLTCIPLPATNFEMMSRESTVAGRLAAWPMPRRTSRRPTRCS